MTVDLVLALGSCHCYLVFGRTHVSKSKLVNVCVGSTYLTVRSKEYHLCYRQTGDVSLQEKQYKTNLMEGDTNRKKQFLFWNMWRCMLGRHARIVWSVCFLIGVVIKFNNNTF